MVLGLPAILFSIGPLIGSQLAFFESLDQAGTRLDVSMVHQVHHRAYSPPSLYIVGIDGSRSFTSESNLKDSLDALFQLSADIPALVSEENRLEVYLFATESIDLGPLNLAAGRRNLTTLGPKLVEGLARTNELGPETTDVLSFFDKRVCRKVGGSAFGEVKVLIFSDLIFSDIPGPQSPFLSQLLKPCPESSTPVSVTAFYARSGLSVEQPESEDLGLSLAGAPDSAKWTIVSLDRFLQAKNLNRGQLQALYRNAGVAPPFYLKYMMTPTFSPISSSIRQSAVTLSASATRTLSLSPTPYCPDALRLSIGRNGYRLAPGTSLTVDGANRSDEMDIALDSPVDIPQQGLCKITVLDDLDGTRLEIPIITLRIRDRVTILTLGLLLLALNIFPLSVAGAIFRVFFPAAAHSNLVSDSNDLTSERPRRENYLKQVIAPSGVDERHLVAGAQKRRRKSKKRQR